MDTKPTKKRRDSSGLDLPNHCLMALLILAALLPPLGNTRWLVVSVLKSINTLLVSRKNIDAEGKGPSSHKECQRNNHGHSRAVSVRSHASKRRNTSTTNNSTNDKATTALRVSAESSHTKSDNSWETDGFKEQHHVEHGNSCITSLCNRRAEEDNTHAEEDEEDAARLEVLHEEDAEEATNSKCSLCTCKELGTGGITGILSRFGGVVDEHASNTHLSATVTELCEGGVKESVLLSQWLIVSVRVGGFGLSSHI